MNLNVITDADAVRAIDAVRKETEPPTKIADEQVTTPVAGAAPQVTADDLYSRLLKYIPAPLIGVYLMATNLIIGLASDGKEPSKVALLIALLFFLAATVAYLIVRKVRRPWQISLSALAFVTFAAGSPGIFQYWGSWHPEYATYALIVVAVIFIVFKPSPLPDGE